MVINTINPIAINGASVSTASRSVAAHDDPRRAAQQVVGQTFLGTLLGISRESPFQTRFGHGGRGEEVFQAELDRVLIERSAGRLGGRLADAICRSLARSSAQMKSPTEAEPVSQR